jgi:predicted metal-binding membrane protein
MALPGRGRELSASSGAALRHGLLHGLHCLSGCAGLTAILLVIGMMDLRAMTAVAAAITAERLAPAGERVARVTGVVAIVVGLVFLGSNGVRLH